MARFLIEVPHDSDTLSCYRAVHVFLETGSHFLTHAEWGCADNDHRCWILVDVENKAEALAIVPPPFRAKAHIVTLIRFTLPQVEAALRKYSDAGSGGSGGA